MLKLIRKCLCSVDWERIIFAFWRTIEQIVEKIYLWVYFQNCCSAGRVRYTVKTDENITHTNFLRNVWETIALWINCGISDKIGFFLEKTIKRFMDFSRKA